VAALVAAPGAAAQGGVTAPDLSDPCPAVYPGDSASQERLARWMARSAADRGLPRELPVMAAIAESGLRNLRGEDYHGFFGMHESLNAGVYRGFPSRPELQLRWFLDSAAAVRQRRIAEGFADPAADESDFGLWVADVERPAPQNRSGYQPYLGDAGRLIGSRCPAPASADTAPPPLAVRIARRQAPATGTVEIRLRCPQEGCRVGAVLGVSVRGKLRQTRASAASPADGAWLELTVPVPRAARRLLARGRSVPAVVRAIGVSESARSTTAERQVRLFP
jgi:hypothetical protein